MNKINFNHSLILLAMVCITIFSSCTNSENKSGQMSEDKMQMEDSTKMMASNKMMQSMENMMNKMSSMKMTQDFDYDFATMMIEHHKGAIEMAQEEIGSGSDEKIKGMAKKIISDQQTEIEKMSTFLNTYNSTQQKSSGNEDGLMQSMEPMKNFMKEMKMSGNTDKDFVMMMIEHHKAAIKMAESELAGGHHEEIKQMAKQMIEAQSNEIGEFQKWMETQK